MKSVSMHLILWIFFSTKFSPFTVTVVEHICPYNVHTTTVRKCTKSFGSLNSGKQMIYIMVIYLMWWNFSKFHLWFHVLMHQLKIDTHFTEHYDLSIYHKYSREIPDFIYCPCVMASSAMGLKLGVFGFLPTTHAKTNTKPVCPRSSHALRHFTHVLSSRSDGRCRWLTHLTNHGYFDYGENPESDYGKNPQFEPMPG